MEVNAADPLIAKFIAFPEDPPNWLVLAACKARQTLAWTIRKEADYPGRAEWRKRLERLESAAKEVRARVCVAGVHPSKNSNRHTPAKRA